MVFSIVLIISYNFLKNSKKLKLEDCLKNSMQQRGSVLDICVTDGGGNRLTPLYHVPHLKTLLLGNHTGETAPKDRVSRMYKYTKTKQVYNKTT